MTHCYVYSFAEMFEIVQKGLVSCFGGMVRLSVTVKGILKGERKEFYSYSMYVKFSLENQVLVVVI